MGSGGDWKTPVSQHSKGVGSGSVKIRVCSSRPSSNRILHFRITRKLHGRWAHRSPSNRTNSRIELRRSQNDSEDPTRAYEREISTSAPQRIRCRREIVSYPTAQSSRLQNLHIRSSSSSRTHSPTLSSDPPTT